MSKWEDALRNALRREDPPDGFAQRVMAKVEARHAASGAWSGLAWVFHGPRLRWATALASIALVIGGLDYWRWRDERAQGERAKQQVMLALRIAGGKLRLAQARVQRVGGTVQD